VTEPTRIHELAHHTVDRVAVARRRVEQNFYDDDGIQNRILDSVILSLLRYLNHAEPTDQAEMDPERWDGMG
jgi:hypothetical protein